MSDVIDDRHRTMDALRAGQPVHRDQPSATFVLTRLADSRALLTDPTLWKDADKAEPNALVRKFKPADMNRPGDRDSGILWMDNPDHARVRTPIAMALNRRVAGLRPVLEQVVARRLEAVAGRDRFDLVAEIGIPIPIETIGLLLGVDTADQPKFRAWSEAALGSFLPNPTPAELAATKAAAEAISDYLDEVMTRRRAEPRDDLISDLLAAQARDGTLSDSEIRVNCLNLLLGGNITTADLIANAAWLLMTHPSERRKLAEDPALIKAAIEEVLRFEPPAEGAQRVASREMAIDGCPIHTGQVVAVLIHAANRDPSVFPDPHRFDITRKDGPHVAFGGGAHICIGQGLARLEAQVTIGALFRRFPTLRLADPDAPPVWRATPFFRGLETLNVLP